MEKEIVFFDQFRQGMNLEKENGTWSLLRMGSFALDDGIAEKTEDGICIKPKGINKETGKPEYTATVRREALTQGIPAIFDHIKWQASVNHTSSSGLCGFDAVPGKSLAIEAVMGCETYGTKNHPFGDAVLNSEDDFRLASAVLLIVDPKSNMVFDFFLTNTTIYAFYERVPSMRRQLGNYAAFSYAFPVAKRKTGDYNRLKIAYNQDRNTVKWFVDGKEVFSVSQIGKRIGREGMFLDAGGEEEMVTIEQLNCGLALFTLLDGALNGKPALVDLSGKAEYFDPRKGEPEPLRFVDGESREESRLFGQGAELRCQEFSVFYETE